MEGGRRSCFLLPAPELVCSTQVRCSTPVSGREPAAACVGWFPRRLCFESRKLGMGR